MSLSPGYNFASEGNCFRNELQNLERLLSILKGSKNVPGAADRAVRPLSDRADWLTR
jgi:hypothetical protein